MDRYLFLSAMPWAYELSASDSFVISQAVDRLHPLLFEGSNPSQDTAREVYISTSLKSTGRGSRFNIDGDGASDSAMRSNSPNPQPNPSAMSAGLCSYNTISLCLKRAACCVIYGGKLLIFSGGKNVKSSSSTSAASSDAATSAATLDPAQMALEIYVMKHVRGDSSNGDNGDNGQHSLDSTTDHSTTNNSNSSKEAQGASISTQEALHNNSNNDNNDNSSHSNNNNNIINNNVSSSNSSNSADIEPPPCLIFRLDDKYFAIDHRDITSLRQPRGPDGGLSPAAQVTSSFLVFSDGMELRLW